MITTATLAAAPAVPAGATARDRAGEPAGPAVALLDELAAQRITVDYRDQPLLRVANELDVVVGLPLSIDWASLDRLGVEAALEHQRRRHGEVQGLGEARHREIEASIGGVEHLLDVRRHPAKRNSREPGREGEGDTKGEGLWELN